MSDVQSTVEPYPPHIAALLVEAFAAGQQRNFPQAIDLFTAVIQAMPEAHEAHFNLGVALRGARQLEAAIEAFETAVRLRPTWPEAHFNLGNSYRDARQREQAIRAYETAVAQRPSYLKALNNLAVQYFEQGQLAQAEQLLVKALQTKPDYPEGLFNLGRVYRRLRRVHDAATATARAVALQPKNTKFRLKLAELQRLQQQPALAKETLEGLLRDEPDQLEAILALTTMLRDQNKQRDALAVVEQALARGMLHVDLLWQRADIQRVLGHLDQALADLNRARQLDPNSPNVENLLGVLWFAKGEPHKAVAYYERAVALRPDMSEAYNNLGAALQATRRYRDSLAAFNTALHHKPDFAVAHLNRSLTILREGDYEAGWHEFEWRFHCHEYRLTFNNRPAWSGGPVAGKTILLRSEQGLGDTLQFIRYAELVQERGARVLVECQPAVRELVAGCAGVDTAFARGAPLPHIDFQIPMMSLPLALGTSLATIPNRVPYLHANAELVEKWRTRLAPLGKFIIGIGWQGNKKFQADHMRSLPLAHYRALASIPGVALVSLQKNDGAEQLKEELGFTVHQFTEELDASGPFRDTAAIMTAADMVITSDTSIAHLAGALGRPTWLALHYSADWRWLSQGDASPWYPTMRLFRQPQFGQWSGVFEQMRAELSQVIHSSRMHLWPTTKLGCARLEVETAPGELLDKISILEIKAERITEPGKLASVHRELESLRNVRATRVPASQKLQDLAASLRLVNQQLWDIEDAIRACEHRQDFGPEFIELARSVYRTNDQRAALKRAINELLGSSIQEEKSYVSYGQ